jgi:hypothetical protein
MARLGKRTRKEMLHHMGLTRNFVHSLSSCPEVGCRWKPRFGGE